MLPTPINNQATSTDNSADNNRQNKGTGFTNIGSILNANQGAGAKIGQAVGSSIAGQANQVKAGIQSSQDQFNTDKNTATTNANSAVNAGSTYARQAGESDDAYTSRLNGADTDYSAIGKNLASAAYNGPTALNNGDQLNAQAANVTALGRLAGTADGQSQLLRSQVAQKGQYSTGQNSLDSLLLGTGGQQYLQPARSEASQVGSQASNAVLNASGQANAAKSAIDNNRVSALQSLQSSLTGNGTVDATSNPNGITGLETDATNAATAYTNNAQRLQQLLAGKDANGNNISATGTGTAALTDSDKALLQHMSDYGIAGGSLYVDPNDPSAANSALGNYASNLTTQGLGNQLYTDPQRSAATNLAKLLQDSQSQTDIAGQTFNKDIQNDTQASQAQAALDSLSGGINGTLASDQSKQSALQDLLSQYGGYANMDDLQHQTGGGGAFNNGQAAVSDLGNRFQAATGQNIGSILSGQGDKSLANLLSNYRDKYGSAATADQANLTGNTQSIQAAALKRLLGQ